jgi:ubiquinol-cytochrome c reductase cytochrome c subunit
MRRLRLLLAAGAFTAFAAGTVALAQPQSGIVRPSSEPAEPSVALGAELFAGNCSSCHGIDGAGVFTPRPGAGDISGAGPSLRGVGERAADFYLRLGLMPLENIHAQPEIRRVLFSEKEIRSLVAYVGSLGAGPPIPHPEPARGSLAAGFHLFSEHCAGCHQAVAAGGFVTGARVPPLQRLTPAQIAEAVRVGPYLMPRFSTAQISDAQLNSIVAYVRSTNHPDNRGGWAIGNLGPIPEGLIAWLAAIVLAMLCLGLGRRLRG